MRIALIQSNPLVGDLSGNRAALQQHCGQAAAQGAQLALAPELALWGYPPRDLLLRPSLLEEQGRQLDQLCRALPPGLSLLAGVVEPQPEGLYNSMALVEAHRWRVVARKRLLPSYDVFDELRYFRAGQEPCWLDLTTNQGKLRLGLSLCEDLWVSPEITGYEPQDQDPVGDLQPFGIDLLINLSASPYGHGKRAQRQQLAAAAARRLQCPVLYVNQVGGNDELIFDGNSFVIAPSGALLCTLPCASSAVGCWETPLAPGPESAQGQEPPPPLASGPAGPDSDLAELWQVLVLGLRDYAHKCGFRQALVGLSGGIDSALVACLAVAALGADQGRALLMPSPYSSAGSLQDAEALAQRLGLRHNRVPIAPLMGAFDQGLDPVLGSHPQGVSAENLQARIRGTLLMAVANQEGQLLLATGNKSELAVGYCTLYGDMNGGLAVIGDLYKTEVFALASWLDSGAAAAQRRACGLPAEGELIGAAIREKPPSAELRPDQKDSDSLPDYGVLDPLLKRLVEDHASPEDLVAEGANREEVERIWGLLRRAEFKRRQAAPVLKLSARAFGSGWRMPIAAGG